MTDPNKPEEAKAMTLEAAAKAVKRKAADVLDFRDYGTHVVVVTVDGQKLSTAKDGSEE